MNPPNQLYTYNTDMVTIVKPVPYLNTTARNKLVQPLQSFTKGQKSAKVIIKCKIRTHRLPPLSCLPSCWSTSISIIAASRYFLIPRTILTATISFFSLSQHSKTWPKVPELNILNQKRQLTQNMRVENQ